MPVLVLPMPLLPPLDGVAAPMLLEPVLLDPVLLDPDEEPVPDSRADPVDGLLAAGCALSDLRAGGLGWAQAPTHRCATSRASSWIGFTVTAAGG